MRAAHGDASWHAHAFPLSVDGVEIVASLVLLADRRTGCKSGWLPWAGLTVGTAASLCANIATAHHGMVSRVIAGWPAVALLIAVKLLSGILEHRTAADSRTDVRPADSEGPVDRQAVRPNCAAAPPACVRSSADQSGGGIARDDIPVLEQAARAVRDELHRDGRPLTRDVLAARLRAAGYPVRNATLTPLLATLRAEPAQKTQSVASAHEVPIGNIA